MPEISAQNKQIAALIIIFCLNISKFSLCSAADAELDSRLSVSILSNPINVLAQKINDTANILEEKQQELREKKGVYGNIFLIILAACSTAVAWMVFSGIFKRRLKREERRIKRERKRILRKRKKKR